MRSRRNFYPCSEGGHSTWKLSAKKDSVKKKKVSRGSRRSEEHGKEKKEESFLKSEGGHAARGSEDQRLLESKEGRPYLHKRTNLAFGRKATSLPAGNNKKVCKRKPRSSTRGGIVRRREGQGIRSLRKEEKQKVLRKEK